MLRQTMLRLTLACLPMFALVGCTFNVSTFEQDVRGESDGDVRTLNYTSSEHVDVSVVGSRAVVRGSATVSVAGLLGGSERVSADAFVPVWTETTANAYVLTVPTTGAPSGLIVERLALEVPDTADVVLTLADESLFVRGLAGRLEAETTSGSISATSTGVVDLSATSGSINATAREGRVAATSGSIQLALQGWVVASTTSGSIAGAIGDGGSARAESGSIELALIRPLTRDLEITVTSGSVHVLLPRGAPTHLDLASDSGSVVVVLDDVFYDGRAYRGDTQGGGPSLIIRAESGSIDVVSGR